MRRLRRGGLPVVVSVTVSDRPSVNGRPGAGARSAPAHRASRPRARRRSDRGSATGRTPDRPRWRRRAGETPGSGSRRGRPRADRTIGTARRGSRCRGSGGTRPSRGPPATRDTAGGSGKPGGGRGGGGRGGGG